MSEGTLAQVLAGEATWCVVTGENGPVLASMPPKSVGHVIMDPPYSEHVHGKSRAGARKVPLSGRGGEVKRCDLARRVDLGFASITGDEIETMAGHCERLATRWSLAFSDVESCHLWRGAFTSAGLDFCRTGAWIKVGATPQFTGDRPAAGFEAITIVHPKGKKRWNGGGSHAVWAEPIALNRGGNGSRPDHPTVKPTPLLETLVSLFTDPGDLILDPYAGSGTTGVAALRLGRRCIMVEREPKWAELARERCRAEESGSTLRARQAGQVPMFGGGV